MGNKGKKENKGIISKIMPIIAPVLIIIMLGACFYAITSGIIGVVIQIVGKVIETVVGMAQNAWDWIKGVFGISTVKVGRFKN